MMPLDQEVPYRDEDEEDGIELPMPIPPATHGIERPTRRRFAGWHLMLVGIGCLMAGTLFGKSIGKNTTTTEDSQQQPLQQDGPIEDQVSNQEAAANSNYQSTYCPGARCDDTDLCHPCQQRFLFIFSTERTASATLMNMLGSLPGIRMAGENHNTLEALREMFASTVDDPHWREDGQQMTGWNHNYIPTQSQACAAQEIMSALNPPQLQDDHVTLVEPRDKVDQEIIAFKSSDFITNEHDPKQLAEFMKMNFPCSRFLLNICSDVEHLAEDYKKLGLDTTTPMQQLKEDINERQRKMKEFGHYAKQQSKIVDKMVWTSNITHFNDIVHWLGFDEECQFDEYLLINDHGDNGHFAHKTELSHPLTNCHPI